MTDIMFVGEAFGAKEEELGQPFVGPSGSVLNGLLRQVGIERGDCVLTNVFNFRPVDNDVETLLTKEEKFAAAGWPTYAPKRWVHRDYAMSLQELTELRHAINPNVIVALGDTAMWALTHQRGIMKKRGAPLMTFDGAHKVIPTIHPAAVMRQWELRPVVFMDFTKALRESKFPELIRPQRRIFLRPTLDDIEHFYEQYIVPADELGVDIETKDRQITEIGFATAPDCALVIPFWLREAADGNYWPDAKSERKAWDWVKRIMLEKDSIGQNFQYDMTYLYTGTIPCPRFVGDTMLLHHAMQPELKKGLGFLGSVYTNEPSWKFMRQGIETLKKED